MIAVAGIYAVLCLNAFVYLYKFFRIIKCIITVIKYIPGEYKLVREYKG